MGREEGRKEEKREECISEMKRKEEGRWKEMTGICHVKK